MIKVVIFAPHSYCVSTERDCDRRAKASADALYTALLRNGVPANDITYITHEVIRENHDLNRFPSRNVEPRQRLREVVMNFYNDSNVQRIYLFEMHSFPEGWEIGIEGKKIVVLNYPTNELVGSLLVDYIGGNSKGIYLYNGTETIDIQVEFSPGRKKIAAFLIEFNETDILNQSESDYFIDRIAKFAHEDIVSKHIAKNFPDGNFGNLPEDVVELNTFINRNKVNILLAIICILILIILSLIPSTLLLKLSLGAFITTLFIKF
jgi:hypothetical protein